MADAKNLEVKILEKGYIVACPEDKRHDLETAASYLDEKMREIRSTGKVHGTERIAVMAALNITYELLEKNNIELGDNKILSELSEKLDLVLET